MRYIIFLVFLLSSSICFAQTREIAITIDDLPLVASNMNSEINRQRATERFNKIIEAFLKYEVPATGFVIAGSIGKGQWEFLEQFRDAGLSLGNHTYSHLNLNQVGSKRYIDDIQRADKILSPLMSSPKYFRYPYLAEGNKTSKKQVCHYLAAHHYIIAPVTIDSQDFRFNSQIYKVPFSARESYINKIKPRYLAFIWNQTLKAEKDSNGKQILLIHANLLNSYLLEDVLKMYKDNGYRFINLSEALENPAPALIFNAPETGAEAPLESKLIQVPLTEAKKSNNSERIKL